MLITLAEASELLALSVSTIRKMVASGELPSVEVGVGKGPKQMRSYRRISDDDLKAWIDSRRTNGNG